ncbi:hypothetical protein [Algoriphagus sp.]|nr:hypothetical protein [Algoriphagus sp.]
MYIRFLTNGEIEQPNYFELMNEPGIRHFTYSLIKKKINQLG